tara:strand:+ start:34557 stop:34907 length:351 start_codon:yes stop_codon:yes gene_type:complete
LRTQQANGSARRKREPDQRTLINQECELQAGQQTILPACFFCDSTLKRSGLNGTVGCAVTVCVLVLTSALDDSGIRLFREKPVLSAAFPGSARPPQFPLRLLCDSKTTSLNRSPNL